MCVCIRLHMCQRNLSAAVLLTSLQMCSHGNGHAVLRHPKVDWDGSTVFQQRPAAISHDLEKDKSVIVIEVTEERSPHEPCYQHMAI